MSGKACAPQNARARALVATMTGCRVTSDWSRGTRAESSRASVRGPLFVDDNLVRARVRDGAGYVARTPFKKLVILDLVTFSPPPWGRVRPNCGTQARLEGTPDRLLEEEPAPRRSPDAQVLPAQYPRLAISVPARSAIRPRAMTVHGQTRGCAAQTPVVRPKEVCQG
jgi:hypothetical protein